jgi:OOP family OmpA-OmpF porin
MKFAKTVRLFGAATVASLLMAPAAQADSGFQIGVSIGESNVTDELNIEDEKVAYKAMFGYIFDLPAVDFGLELAYIDFGAGRDTLGVAPTNYDATALTGFGTVGVDFGLFGFFGKLGYASWDLEASVAGLGSASADGTDLAYGLGMRLNFSSIEVRAEYELFDIEDAPDDIDLLSVGVVWRF